MIARELVKLKMLDFGDRTRTGVMGENPVSNRTLSVMFSNYDLNPPLHNMTR